MVAIPTRAPALPSAAPSMGRMGRRMEAVMVRAATAAALVSGTCSQATWQPERMTLVTVDGGADPLNGDSRPWDVYESGPCRTGRSD